MAILSEGLDPRLLKEVGDLVIRNDLRLLQTNRVQLRLKIFIKVNFLTFAERAGGITAEAQRTQKEEINA